MLVISIEVLETSEVCILSFLKKLYGERQFLQVLPFTDKWGLDWLSR
jgi:hypothetical protein